MDLMTYLRSLPDEGSRKSFAEKCGTSIGYLRKAHYAGQRIAAATCVLIEQESDGAVTRKELRDDWPAIWPELSGICAAMKAP